MKTVKLTSKRQVTFPAEVCRELGLEAGDEIDLIPTVEKGEPGWTLRKHGKPSRAWIGSLSHCAAQVTDHSMEAVRESIAKGRREES